MTTPTHPKHVNSEVSLAPSLEGPTTQSFTS